MGFFTVLPKAFVFSEYCLVVVLCLYFPWINRGQSLRRSGYSTLTHLPGFPWEWCFVITCGPSNAYVWSCFLSLLQLFAAGTSILMYFVLSKINPWLFFFLEQRMLLQSQLTVLAERVEGEEGGCNSMPSRGWNNTKLSILCLATCYVLCLWC